MLGKVEAGGAGVAIDVGNALADLDVGGIRGGVGQPELGRGVPVVEDDGW